MYKRNAVPFIIGFLVLLLVAWFAFLNLPEANLVRTWPATSVVDLRWLDFDDNVYTGNWTWDSWPDELYTPAQLATGAIPAPRAMTAQDETTVQYVTHRLRIELPGDGTYALSLRSCDYSMRMYINGKEVALVGLPGKTRADSVARVQDMVIYFTPVGTEADIVVQTSNFVHRQGCGPPQLTVGTAENIGGREDNAMLRVGVIIGCLMTAALYNLSLFMVNRNRRSSHLLALGCVLLVCMVYRPIPFLIPEYNFQVALKAEYTVHFLTFTVLVLFMQSLFPRMYAKWVARVFCIISIVFCVVTIFTDSTFFSYLMPVYHVISGLMILYTFVRLVMGALSGRPQKVLALVGVCPLLVFAVSDMLYTSGLPSLGRLGGLAFASPIGMVFFVLCYALVVSFDYAETAMDASEAKRQLAEAELRYTQLEQEFNAETKYPTLDDLGLSPREKQLAMLLLAGKSREESADVLGISLGTVNTLCSRIYKKTGADGLFGLMVQLGMQK